MATWKITGQQLTVIVFRAVKAGFEHSCEGQNGEYNNLSAEQLLEHHRNVAKNVVEEMLAEIKPPEEEKS